MNAELDFAEERAKEYLKKSYLFIYNCIMFLGFSYVFWSLAYRMYVRGPKVYEESVDAMGIPVAVLQVRNLLGSIIPSVKFLDASSHLCKRVKSISGTRSYRSRFFAILR